MNELIDQLYYVLQNPLVTPASIISNIRLPNYSHLEFRKEGNKLLASLECCLEDGEHMEFLYCFDENDFLERLICMSKETGIQEILFDRTKEVALLQKRLLQTKKEMSAELAI